MKYHNSNLTDVENVGEQLRRIRKEKGLTQAQAAKLTYHTRDWLSNVEIGRTPITFVDAVKQLEAYGRLEEVDHLVQSICTSTGTRQSSAVIRTIKFNKGCLMDYFGFINSLLVPSACNIKQSISMRVSSAAFPFHILFLKYIILCH